MITSLNDVRRILEQPESEDYVTGLLAAQSFLSGIPGPTALVYTMQVKRALASAQIAAQEAIDNPEAEDTESFAATRFGETLFPNGNPTPVTEPAMPFTSLDTDATGPLPKRIKKETLYVLGQEPRMAEDIMPGE